MFWKDSGQVMDSFRTGLEHDQNRFETGTTSTVQYCLQAVVYTDTKKTFVI